MPKATVMTQAEMVARFCDVLEKYGPALERLVEHFDRLEKSGITGAAAKTARENPPADADPASQLVDMLGGFLKQKIRQGPRRRA